MMQNLLDPTAAPRAATLAHPRSTQPRQLPKRAHNLRKPSPFPSTSMLCPGRSPQDPLHTGDEDQALPAAAQQQLTLPQPTVLPHQEQRLVHVREHLQREGGTAVREEGQQCRFADAHLRAPALGGGGSRLSCDGDRASLAKGQCSLQGAETSVSTCSGKSGQCYLRGTVGNDVQWQQSRRCPNLSTQNVL